MTLAALAAPASKILVVDRAALLEQSKAGQDIIRQVKAATDEVDKEHQPAQRIPYAYVAPLEELEASANVRVSAAFHSTGALDFMSGFGPGSGAAYAVWSPAPPTSVPESGTLFLFGAGILGLGALRRRQKAKKRHIRFHRARPGTDGPRIHPDGARNPARFFCCS